LKVVVFEIHPRSDVDQEAYDAAFEEMVELVAQIPGFVSIQGFTGEGGTELALARFEDDEAIRKWREQPRHVETRDRGRSEFFESYDITIATVSRHYHWVRGEPPPLFEEPSRAVIATEH
jgi:heme-degrading monooxygenase HmoA